VRSQFDLYDQLEVVQAASTIILAGVNLHLSRSVAFFDAIALSSALAEGCNVIRTEGMISGEVDDGVHISNSFASIGAT
jgi:predicted nucleic acid-binding protein